MTDATAPGNHGAEPSGVDPGKLVSVIIPAADEADNIPPLLQRVNGVLASRGWQHEIIVVVRNPEDPTRSVAASGGARVLVQKRPGYGGALKEGLLAARGDYIVTMDADLSHPPEKILDLLERRDDAEVIVCSRYVAGGTARMPFKRALLSRVLNFLFSRLLALPVRDSSSGFRIYQRRIFKELEITGEKYDVLQEILVKTYSLGWRVVEIPFDYMPRASGESHARILDFIPHFLSTLSRLFKLRNNFRCADYDARAYDSLVLPQRYWQRRRYELVTEMLGGTGRRLDVGCGSSKIIQSSPGSVGLDLELPKLRFLRNTNPLLVQGSTYALPFPSGSFGAAVHSQVIEHIPYDRRIFTELNRILKLGGVLVIGTPDYGRIQWVVIEKLYKLLLPNGYGDDHITHYTRYELAEELATAGFAIIRYEYILGGELIMKCIKREEASLETAA